MFGIKNNASVGKRGSKCCKQREQQIQMLGGMKLHGVLKDIQAIQYCQITKCWGLWQKTKPRSQESQTSGSPSAFRNNQGTLKLPMPCCFDTGILNFFSRWQGGAQSEMSEVHALGIKFKVTPKHSIIKISNILTQYLKKKNKNQCKNVMMNKTF